MVPRLPLFREKELGGERAKLSLVEVHLLFGHLAGRDVEHDALEKERPP